MKTKPTILITAYAINPYWGSEHGMGWNFITNIPTTFDLKVITRAENEQHIIRFVAENHLEFKNIEFYYFDFTKNRKWNKSAFTVMFHYLIWQYRIISFISKNNLEFDLCHCLNFHTDWMPSFLYKFKKPFIWGPIGHHSKIPTIFLTNYPLKYSGVDLLTWFIKLYFWNVDPSLKRTIKSADRILIMNSNALPSLPRPDNRLITLTSVGSKRYLNKWTQTEALQKYSNKKIFNIICIARFVPLKGIDIALQAFANFLEEIERPNDVKFTIIGKGGCEDLYHEMIGILKLQDYVNIVKWMPHEELNDLYKSSHVFLFPSHEGAGMVVVEALANGLPVVCLDNDGPGEIIDDTCGFKIKATTFNETTKNIAEKLVLLYHSDELCINFSVNAFHRWSQIYSWDCKGEILGLTYTSVLKNEDSSC